MLKVRSPPPNPDGLSNLAWNLARIFVQNFGISIDNIIFQCNAVGNWRRRDQALDSEVGSYSLDHVYDPLLQRTLPPRTTKISI